MVYDSCQGMFKQSDDEMEPIFTGQLFQSEGALNIKAFFGLDFETLRGKLKGKAGQYVWSNKSRKREPKTFLNKKDNWKEHIWK